MTFIIITLKQASYKMPLLLRCPEPIMRLNDIFYGNFTTAFVTVVALAFFVGRETHFSTFIIYHRLLGMGNLGKISIYYTIYKRHHQIGFVNDDLKHFKCE